MNPHALPQAAKWLLECLLPEANRETIVGDLIEETALRARASTRITTAWWCWGQVARSIPVVLWSELRRRHWFKTVGVAVMAYVSASLIELVSTAVISRMFRPDARLDVVLSVIVGLATMMLGGYVAASIRQGAASVLGAIILIVVGVLFVTMPNSAPFWYGLTFLVAGPLAALAGGWLNVTRRTGRTHRAG